MVESTPTYHPKLAPKVKMLISKKLVTEAIMDNHSTIKAVAMAVLLKKKYGSSAIKNPTWQRLSAITGLSPLTCKKYVNILFEHDLARYENNKELLIISRLYDLIKERDCHKSFRLYVSEYDSVRDIEDLIKCAVLINKDSQRRDYAIRRKLASADLQSPVRLNYERTKRIRASKSGQEPQHYDELGVSYYTMTQIWNESISTVLLRIKRMEKNNLLRKHKNLEVVYSGKDAGLVFKCMQNGSEFHHHYPEDWINSTTKIVGRVNVPKKIFLNGRRDAIIACYSNTYTFNVYTSYVNHKVPQYLSQDFSAIPTPHAHNAIISHFQNNTKIKTKTLIINNLAEINSTVIDFTAPIEFLPLNRKFEFSYESVLAAWGCGERGSRAEE